jgi:hypothetical protein
MASLRSSILKRCTDRCRDARRRFVSGVSCLPLAHLRFYRFMSRRRDAWRRFSSIVSSGIPELISALFGVRSASRRHELRRLASVCQLRIVCLSLAHLRSHGLLSRRRDNKCRDARRRFATTCPMASPGSSTVFDDKVGVATSGVGFPVSCCTSILGWLINAIYTESGVGVATLGVVSPASWCMSSRSFCRVDFEFVVGVATLVGLSSVVLYGIPRLIYPSVVLYGIPRLIYTKSNLVSTSRR